MACKKTDIVKYSQWDRSAVMRNREINRNTYDDKQRKAVSFEYVNHKNSIEWSHGEFASFFFILSEKYKFCNEVFMSPIGLHGIFFFA